MEELRPSIKQGFSKMMSFCTYQERCHKDVIDKLYELKFDKEDVYKITSLLVQENFLNDERFAKSYCRGKFNLNKWGKVKIIQGLKQRQISDFCIKKGLAEIDEKEYLDTLQELIERKKSTLKDKNHLIRKNKLIQFALSKGYEFEYVIQFVV